MKYRGARLHRNAAGGEPLVATGKLPARPPLQLVDFGAQLSDLTLQGLRMVYERNV